jgi:hypothetical protein
MNGYQSSMLERVTANFPVVVDILGGQKSGDNFVVVLSIPQF